MHYHHDPVVEDSTGFFVIQVGVGNVIVEVAGSTLEGASCTVQPAGTQILHQTKQIFLIT